MDPLMTPDQERVLSLLCLIMLPEVMIAHSTLISNCSHSSCAPSPAKQLSNNASIISPIHAPTPATSPIAPSFHALALPPAPLISPPFHASALPLSPPISPPLPALALPISPLFPLSSQSPYWVPVVTTILGFFLAGSLLLMLLCIYYQSLPSAKDLHFVLSSTIISLVQGQDDGVAADMIGDLRLSPLQKTQVALVFLCGIMLGFIEDPHKAAKVLQMLSDGDTSYKDGAYMMLGLFFRMLGRGEFAEYEDAISKVAVYMADLVKMNILPPKVSINFMCISAASLSVPSLYKFTLSFFEEFDSIMEYVGKNMKYVNEFFEGETEADMESWLQFVADVSINKAFWESHLRSKLARIQADESRVPQAMQNSRE